MIFRTHITVNHFLGFKLQMMLKSLVNHISLKRELQIQAWPKDGPRGSSGASSWAKAAGGPVVEMFGNSSMIFVITFFLHTVFVYI